MPYLLMTLRLRAIMVCLFLLFGCVIAKVEACDSFDGNHLTIPAVIVGNVTYTQVVITVNLAGVTVGGAVNDPSSITAPDYYDPNTNRLTIPCVSFNGVNFTNVVVTVGQVVSFGPSRTNSNLPTFIPFTPLPNIIVGQTPAYSQNVVQLITPQSMYTYTIDTLAKGNGVPPGMTFNINGVLSGTAFATGAADVNGYQIPHTYSFGVCATDTLTRNTTTPCPQTMVTVLPTSIAVKLAGTGTGTITASPAGDSCGDNCFQGFASGANVTLTATPDSDSTFTGWSAPCGMSPVCTLTANGAKSITATFSKTLNVTGVWSGTANRPGANYPGCIADTVGFSFSLNEDTAGNITGQTGGGSQLSGTIQGKTLNVMVTTVRYGTFGPYTWNWDGANTITGSTLYYCYDLASLDLIAVSESQFTVTRN